MIFVPRDRWFLDKLLAIQADNGQPVTSPEPECQPAWDDRVAMHSRDRAWRLRSRAGVSMRSRGDL
jgi:hypothetical protein